MKRAAEDDVKIEDIVDEHNNDDTDSAPQLKKARRTCPYLDTIHRNLLDFDFEKVCSVSLTNLNVYACLVCGKYFQGRGRGSHAYIHSLEVNHHVYIHLFTNKIYCLPDDYEVVDSSLDDIKRALNTTYTKEEIAQLDRQQRIGRTLDGRGWVAGVIGLNPMATGQATLNDYFNVVFQSLAHVPHLRDYFLWPENYQHCKSELVHRFGILIRKLWSPHNYRNLVTPHELLQEVTLRSEKKFKIGSKGDPLEFLSWFLNTLHADLTADKRRGRSIVHDCFQGQVHVTTEREQLVDVTEPSPNTASSAGAEGAEGKKKRRRVKQNVVTARETPFLYLSLDVPPPPLFKDEAERNIIPQEPIFTLLHKFNGSTVQYLAATNEKKKYQLTALPKYIVFAIKRFTNNAFFMEKNPTIVNFPIKNLDLAEYVQFGDEKTSTKYDLVANIRHEGQTKKPSEGSYAVHLYHKANDQWYNIQDTRVEEVMPALIVLSEAYIQIYERNDTPA